MDYNKFMNEGIGEALKKMPLSVQADMNSFIQEIGGKLNDAIHNNEDIEEHLFKRYGKLKEDLKNTIDEHNKMQSKHGDNSKK